MRLISRTRLETEEGFTLVEVLIVVLIIAILAGIALAIFSTQRDKANDADAKSNASGLATSMKTCFVETEDYNDCDGAGAGDKLGNTGLPIGNGPGQVSVTVPAADSFVVTAVSKVGTGSTNHQFVVTETNGKEVRTCTGCQGGTW
jgi:type IV pilus assembly protein PilA